MMNTHKHYEDLQPLFIAGQLSEAEQVEMQNHLASCAECRADLALWETVSAGIRETSWRAHPPANAVATALSRVQETSTKGNQVHSSDLMRHAWALLRAQASLVQREMWPASTAVMALGVMVALISKHVEAIYFLAPLVAAASLSVLFSPEYDPAYELTLSTPTSPWKVLLARLSIVSAYNLLLTLVAAIALLTLIPPGLMGTLILGWLAPMAFLSTLALLLSLWIGTGNAIAVTYILWIIQYMPYQSIGAWMISPSWSSAVLTYQRFWHSPALLFTLSLLLIGMVLWSANRPSGRLVQGIG